MADTTHTPVEQDSKQPVTAKPAKTTKNASQSELVLTMQQLTLALNDFGSLLQRVSAMREQQREVQKSLTPAAQQEEGSRDQPWRMELEAFKQFADGVEANWDEGGNSRVGQRLAVALRRRSGHAEGQLYINWSLQCGRKVVQAFWEAEGWYESKNATTKQHKGIPPGL